MAHTATEQIRVIIADDHPIVREGLAAILGSPEDIKIVTELLMARRPANSMISFLPTSLSKRVIFRTLSHIVLRYPEVFHSFW